jgi:hypothetical protein
VKFAFIAKHRGYGPRDGCAGRSVSRAVGSMPGRRDRPAIALEVTTN